MRTTPPSPQSPKITSSPPSSAPTARLPRSPKTSTSASHSSSTGSPTQPRRPASKPRPTSKTSPTSAKPDDAAHVAAAFVSDCSVLVSWNLKHITNIRRAERFNAAASFLGYTKPLGIVTPSEVLYADEE